MIPAMARVTLVNARIATMRGGKYSIVESGALEEQDGRVTWIGDSRDARAQGAGREDAFDAAGALVTPGLVDCHTHLVYAGHRAADFERRLSGATYAEIAKAGGGILSTMRATRDAAPEVLQAQSLRRLDALLAEGVTAVEVKSGYALDVEGELKLLRVARALARLRRVHVSTTLLGAHAVPPEYAGRADDYVRLVCETLIPAVAREGLADAVDAFCESIAFTPAQTRRVFEAARAHGLRVRLHADQLSNGGGAALAAEFGALTADHLEHTDEAGVQALARAGTVAVLLPVAFYFLRETRRPPIDLLRRHQVAMAVATDCNPGTAPCASLLTAINMACTLFELTPEEALAGATVHAARALGAPDRGVLEPGRRADFVVWDAQTPAELAWTIAGRRPLQIKTAPEGAVGAS